MQAGRRYTFLQTVLWSRRQIMLFIIWSAVPVMLYYFFKLDFIHIPWQPISLIGIAVAFYLGFKNNSSYERLWEARKIWGGIVNASRSFTVMVRDFVNNDEATDIQDDQQLAAYRKNIIHRHVAWLRALSFELRKPKDWEHKSAEDEATRASLGLTYSESNFDAIRDYISTEEFNYVMSKGNRSSHLLSMQSKQLMNLRRAGIIEHFRHLEIQALITEFYTLQGKAERINNFPFPRQYASVNYFFVFMFIALLPFGMLDVFVNLEGSYWIWMTIPFSVVAMWVFWMMEMIGDYSENPFEGLHNDVPISAMARGIEIDIRQMLDEENLPPPLKPVGALKILS